VNAALDELLRVQRGYSVPDTKLRASLLAEIHNKVSARYDALLRSTANLPFTSNFPKYIRYQSREHLDLLIDQLLQGLATTV
jgi:hypothetical protein